MVISIHPATSSGLRTWFLNFGAVLSSRHRHEFRDGLGRQRLMENLDLVPTWSRPGPSVDAPEPSPRSRATPTLSR